jgi:hypothetical protein
MLREVGSAESPEPLNQVWQEVPGSTKIWDSIFRKHQIPHHPASQPQLWTEKLTCQPANTTPSCGPSASSQGSLRYLEAHR